MITQDQLQLNYIPGKLTKSKSFQMLPVMNH